MMRLSLLRASSWASHTTEITLARSFASNADEGVSLSSLGLKLTSSQDARQRRKEEIFAAVVQRADRPTSEKLGKLGFDFGGAEIFNQQVQATAGEILEDKGQAMKTAGHDSVTYFVRDTDSLQQCADLMQCHGVGAVLAVDSRESLVGLVTERDFVKLAAAEVSPQQSVEDLMTPIAKLVHVGPDSGLGECLELMRMHSVRHLPVLGDEAASEAVRRAVAAAKTKKYACDHKVASKKTMLYDMLGTEDGSALYTQIQGSPAEFLSDKRPVCQRLAAALRAAAQADEALDDAIVQESSMKDSGVIPKESLLGVISVRDALATVTKAMMRNLAAYAEEERMKEIEEREGYSE